MTVTKTKLFKSLYLADLQAVTGEGVRPSGFEWVWYRFGPFCADIYRVADDLTRAGWVTETHSDDSQYPEVDYELVDERYATSVDAEFFNIVKELIGRYAKKTSTEWKDITYRTQPMLHLQHYADRGTPIDLTSSTPLPDADDVKAALAGFASFAEQLQVPDPQDLDTSLLVSELDESSGSIQRANRLVGA